MMDTTQIPTETILTRIDAMIKELYWLRRIVLSTDAPAVSPNIVEELTGSLGQGTWEEYDETIDWERFAE